MNIIFFFLFFRSIYLHPALEKTGMKIIELCIKCLGIFTLSSYYCLHGLLSFSISCNSLRIKIFFTRVGIFKILSRLWLIGLISMFALEIIFSRNKKKRISECSIVQITIIIKSIPVFELSYFYIFLHISQICIHNYWHCLVFSLYVTNTKIRFALSKYNQNYLPSWIFNCKTNIFPKMTLVALFMILIFNKVSKLSKKNINSMDI